MSATVEVKIENLDNLKRAFRSYPKISEPILQRAVQMAGDVLAKYTTRETVPYKTGRLLGSFAAKYSRLQALWSPTARYAFFVHEGTQPHIIRYTKPGPGGLYNKKTGQGFGRVVHHPGTKANPFMKTIAERAKEDILKVFKDAEDRIMGEISKQVNIR